MFLYRIAASVEKPHTKSSIVEMVDCAAAESSNQPSIFVAYLDGYTGWDYMT